MNPATNVETATKTKHKKMWEILSFPHGKLFSWDSQNYFFFLGGDATKK